MVYIINIARECFWKRDVVYQSGIILGVHTAKARSGVHAKRIKTLDLVLQKIFFASITKKSKV